MQSPEEMEKILQEHERRIAAIEDLISKRKGALPKREAPSSLADHLIGLRDTGFFHDPQTEAETHARLQSTYHCERDRVGVALLRLANRKLLRRASKTINGKKYNAYVW